MPVFQYTVRDVTGSTRTGSVSADTPKELTYRLKAQGFEVLKVAKSDGKAPCQMFHYIVKTAEGETLQGGLAAEGSPQLAAYLESLNYTVVKITPAVKAWIASGDGDAYRGYVEAPGNKDIPLAEQLSLLQRRNRLLLSLIVGLFAIVIVLTILLLRGK